MAEVDRDPIGDSLAPHVSVATPDSTRRSRRAPERKTCPNCGERIPIGEFEAHQQAELEFATAIEESGNSLSRKRTRGSSSGTPVTRQSSRPKRSAVEQSTDSAAEASDIPTSPARPARTKKKTAPDTQKCPICSEEIYGDMMDVNYHIDACLSAVSVNGGKLPVAAAQNNTTSDGESDNGDPFSTYTIGGVERVRATSMMNYPALFGKQKSARVDVDEDLDIDTDDRGLYGVSQYGEQDLVSLTDDRNDRTLRARVAGVEPIHHHFRRSSPPPVTAATTVVSTIGVANNPPSSSEGSVTLSLTTMWNEQPANRVDSLLNAENDVGSEVPSPVQTSGKDAGLALVVQVLKDRVKELEEEQASGGTKCMVCLGKYDVPVVSIQCWHVHCEACWKQALGARRLCPQCQAILGPADLRKIYL